MHVLPDPSLSGRYVAPPPIETERQPRRVEYDRDRVAVGQLGFRDDDLCPQPRRLCDIRVHVVDFYEKLNQIPSLRRRRPDAAVDAAGSGCRLRDNRVCCQSGPPIRTGTRKTGRSARALSRRSAIARPDFPLHLLHLDPLPAGARPHQHRPFSQQPLQRDIDLVERDPGDD